LGCEGCGLAIVRQKAVSKTMNAKGTQFCEIIFVDGTGPFQTTVSGNSYWYQLMDDLIRKGWNHFQPKSKLDKKMEEFIMEQKAKGCIVKYLHCDVAGENN
jgi:hypothetical protein